MIIFQLSTLAYNMYGAHWCCFLIPIIPDMRLVSRHLIEFVFRLKYHIIIVVIIINNY